RGRPRPLRRQGRGPRARGGVDSRPGAGEIRGSHVGSEKSPLRSRFHPSVAGPTTIGEDPPTKGGSLHGQSLESYLVVWRRRARHCVRTDTFLRLRGFQGQGENGQWASETA